MNSTNSKNIIDIAPMVQHKHYVQAYEKYTADLFTKEKVKKSKK